MDQRNTSVVESTRDNRAEIRIKGAELQRDRGPEDRVVGEIRTFRDLIVWQKSMQLVTDVYRSTQGFPKQELYGLTSQLRRCAISIPSNIAEGFGRQSAGDYARFLSIAAGSLFELETQLEISLNLEYLTRDRFDSLHEQAREVERMLSSLIRKVRPRGG